VSATILSSSTTTLTLPREFAQHLRPSPSSDGRWPMAWPLFGRAYRTDEGIGPLTHSLVVVVVVVVVAAANKLLTRIDNRVPLTIGGIAATTKGTAETW